MGDSDVREQTKETEYASERPATVLEAFDERAAQSPDDVFVAPLSGAAVTYRETQDRARALAAALAIRPGDRVGLYLPNTPAWVTASIAVWSTGASVVACGTLLSPREAARAFAVSNVTAIVTTEPAALQRGEIAVHAVDDGGALQGSVKPTGDASRPIFPGPDDEAVAFFTSGTTGNPKGVPHRHRDLLHWAEQVASVYAKTGAFRVTTAPDHAAPGVIFTPFGHIGGYLALAFRIWVGRSVVLVPKFSADAVAELLSRYDFDALQLTPTMVHMLATADQDLPLGRLRYVTSSTSPLTEATRSAFEGRYGVPVIQAYGMTEVGTIAQERYADVAAGRRPPNSVGRPAEGVEIRIVSEDGNDLGSGSDGEIVVRSATVAAHYMGLSAPQLVDGWFHTGDIGRFDDDGFLFITGRISDRIIVGGFNVYPAEVEDVLRRSEHVLDVVVVGVADDRLGERPIAAVVWSGPPAPDAVRELARAELAHYKVPRSWIAVTAIPLTNRGKIDREAARRLVEGDAA